MSHSMEVSGTGPMFEELPSAEDAGQSLSSVSVLSDTDGIKKNCCLLSGPNRWLGKLMHLVYTLCNIASLTTLVVGGCGRYCQWSYFIAAMLLLDLSINWRFWSRILKIIGRDVRSRKSQRHNFERFVEGVPFTIFACYAVWCFQMPQFAVCWLGEGVSKTLVFLFSIAGVLNSVFMAMAIMDIDSHASSEVCSKLQTSMKGRLTHFIFRWSELVMRLTFLAVTCVVVRPIIGAMWKFESVFTLIVVVFIGCFYYMGMITLISFANGMPNDAFFARFLVGYVSLSVNPFLFFDRAGYKKTAKRMRILLSVLRCTELLFLSGLFVIVWQLNLAMFDKFKRECQEDPHENSFHVLLHFWGMLVQACTFGCLHYFMIVVSPYKRMRVLPCGFSGETALPLLPYQQGQDAQVQSAPQVGIASFMVRLSGGGVINRLVPTKITNTSDFIVEKVLGQGNYGVVVLVRQEREAGRARQRQDQRKFALKLQNTERPDRFHPAIASPSELADRERSIYEKVWNTLRNPVTGGRGHPFILRLECSCAWPEGFVFSDESTKERVEWVRNDGQRTSTFHCALMMEYCQLGSLDVFIKKELRREWQDRDHQGSIRWFRLCQRFTAEILLALDFLHSNQIVYRDLKPENVLLVADWEGSPHIKLGDFGFSKEVSHTDPSKSLAGSPYFSAPEMWQIYSTHVQHVTDASVDVFSLGMLLFVMWYGCELWRTAGKQRKRIPGSHFDPSDPTCKWYMTSTLSIFPKEEELSKLCALPRCPRIVCQVIASSVRQRPSDRATVQRIRDSALFHQLEICGVTVPRTNWEELLSMSL